MAAWAIEALPSPAGHQPTTTSAAGPRIDGNGELLWRFDAGGHVQSSPAVADGVVYFSGDNNVYALDATTGEELWRFETGRGSSSPTVVDGVVYAGNFDGCVYALDAGTGQERWSFKADGETASSAAVLDGLVYVTSQDDHLYALDARTGQERWRWKTADWFTSSPVVADAMVYVFSGSYAADQNEGHVYALDASTGEERWRFKVGDAMASDPAVVDGVAYAGSSDGYMYAIDAATGQEIWRSMTGPITLSSPAVQDGTVYIGSMNGYVYALDATTGEKLWRFSTGSWVASSPAVADGVVYIGSLDNYVYALDAATGAERWRFETGDGVGSSPAVLDGVVYVGSDDGWLYAIDGGGNGEFTGQRPDILCTVPHDIKSYRFTMVTRMDVPQLDNEIEEARRQLEEAERAELQGGEEAPSAQLGLGEGLGAFMLAFLADMRMEAAFVAPDRGELRMEMGNLEFAGIGVGDKQWVRFGETDWRETSEETEELNLLGDLCLGFSFPDVTGYQASEEMRNGVATYHYQLDESDVPQLTDFFRGDTMGIGEAEDWPDHVADHVAVDLWLARDGNWPVRMQAEGRGKDDEGNETSLSLFMEFKDLNDPDIKIEPPIDSD